jgi:hypothetical protein
MDCWYAGEKGKMLTSRRKVWFEVQPTLAFSTREPLGASSFDVTRLGCSIAGCFQHRGLEEDRISTLLAIELPLT